jgi:hypothetical protein
MDNLIPVPIKSANVFKQQLIAAGVVVKERHDPSIRGTRVNHAIALGVDLLAQKGLHVPLYSEVVEES